MGGGIFTGAGNCGDGPAVAITGHRAHAGGFLVAEGGQGLPGAVSERLGLLWGVYLSNSDADLLLVNQNGQGITVLNPDDDATGITDLDLRASKR